ncbi:unnamed protein product [Rhizoctonia solani]|uniref:Protein kinase domain-containing protein n=1 Tax=Rhizoctonia solani TaxID=456999 RepID=A0A8H3E8A0_9AGAM|nr:unnamed protein product [Rhizoctonia solani]
MIRAFVGIGNLINNPLQSTSICAGLAYLHDCNIIHGSLKGTNVLISQDGTPKLMDFGMVNIWDLIPQTNPRPKCLLRWTPWEIYEEKSSYTMSGDIYSLGMTVLVLIPVSNTNQISDCPSCNQEAYTSQVPFAELTDNLLVPHVAVSRNIPTRPETIPADSADGDRLWAMLKKCWSYNPKDRPSAEAIRNEMEAESVKKSTPMDGPSTEEVWSEMEAVTGKNLYHKEHMGTAVDRSEMETITADNVNPVGGPSTEVVRDEAQAITTANVDAAELPTTEDMRGEVEAIRPEHKKKAGGKWRKWLSWKKKRDNN